MKKILPLGLAMATCVFGNENDVSQILGPFLPIVILVFVLSVLVNAVTMYNRGFLKGKVAIATMLGATTAGYLAFEYLVKVN